MTELQLRIDFDVAMEGKRNCTACHRLSKCMGCCLSCKRFDDCDMSQICDEYDPQTEREMYIAFLEMQKDNPEFKRLEKILF
jgi:hypothetical protein